VHSSASKAVAEKARGTYRKTAARFEEFAYDESRRNAHAIY